MPNLQRQLLSTTDPRKLVYQLGTDSPQQASRPTNHVAKRHRLTNHTTTTTATIPYIKGISENTSRILQPFNIRVPHKTFTTLRQLLTSVKDKDKSRNRERARYMINYSDCQASYIGETGRNLTTRLTEHKRTTGKGDVNNRIAEHHRLPNHTIHWDSAQCLTCSANYFQRLTLESWFTNLEQTPLNRCRDRPITLLNVTDLRTTLFTGTQRNA